MKTFRTAFFALAAALLFSCSNDGDGPEDDVIWDIAPLVIHVDVVDEAGNSLIQPDVQGSVVGQDMTLEFKDKVYSLEWKEPSRYYLARFNGLYWHRAFIPDQDDFGPYRISIGEIAQDDNFDYDMVLTFDGVSHNIHITNRFGWRKHAPNIQNDITIDGQPVEDRNIVLKKK